MVCFAVAALLVAVVAIAYMLRLPPPDTGFWQHFLEVSAAICVAIGVIGFLLGPVRMAQHLGFLWGVKTPHPKQRAVVIAVVLALYVVVLFGWPTW